MSDIHKAYSDFLANKPLYSKMEVPQYAFLYKMGGTYGVDGQTFSHFCENCKESRTFKIMRQANEIMRNTKEVTSHCFAICQYCETYRMEIILNVFADPNNTNNTETDKYYIRKIGQNPPFKLMPQKEVNNYLSPDDKENYSKALRCITQNYGIGAFSYFRRIIENEMRRIVKDASGLDMPELENSRASQVIDESFALLPASLRELGQNPIKILWEQLSIGIHALSDEECLENAIIIEEVLFFVIDKINEENTKIKDIRLKLKILQSK